MCICLICIFSACHTDTANTYISDEYVDLDLTKLSSTMVYSQVYNMVFTPEDYIGKKIKINGTFTSYTDTETGNSYFACIIQDATSCCAQGLEFELSGSYLSPEDYPDEGENIVVTGIFDTYTEDDFEYCILRNAVLI